MGRQGRLVGWFRRVGRSNYVLEEVDVDIGARGVAVAARATTCAASAIAVDFFIHTIVAMFMAVRLGNTLVRPEVAGVVVAAAAL